MYLCHLLSIVPHNIDQSLLILLLSCQKSQVLQVGLLVNRKTCRSMERHAGQWKEMHQRCFLGREKGVGGNGPRLSLCPQRGARRWHPPKSRKRALLGVHRGGGGGRDTATGGRAGPGRPPGGADRGGPREMGAGFGSRAAGVAMRSGARRVGEGGPARQRSAPPATRPPGHGSGPAAPLPALSPAEPPVPVPVPCPPKSSWITRPPCGDTAPPGAAARSWASSACWWAMEPWARPAWSSATPPTATPTSTSPPPSIPSPVGTRPGSPVPRPAGRGRRGRGGGGNPRLAQRVPPLRAGGELCR